MRVKGGLQKTPWDPREVSTKVHANTQCMLCKLFAGREIREQTCTSPIDGVKGTNPLKASLVNH